MIIIPDVHGRDFWKKAIEGHENEEIIFLGDYHDPYPHEGITEKESLKNFKEIIEFKKAHINNVVLLIGNHDAHYFSKAVLGSRYDYANQFEINQLLYNNIGLFQMAYIKEFNDKKILFSHAGIQLGWLKNNKALFDNKSIEEVVNIVNELFPQLDKGFFNALGDVHFSRGGWFNYGSMVWADVHEHLENKEWLPNYYQVFGHSQQEKDPIITDNIACLDCRKAFNIDENGSIKSI